MNTTYPSATFESALWLEGLAAALPFLVMGALPSPLNLLHTLGLNIPTWTGIGLKGVVLTVCVLGLIEGLHRWPLPYLGVIGLDLSWIITHRGTYMGMDTRAGLLGLLFGWIDRWFDAVQTSAPSWASQIGGIVLGGRD